MGDGKDDADTQRIRSEKFEEFRMAFSRDSISNQDSARVGGQVLGAGGAGGGAAAGAAAGGAEEEKGSTGSMAA